MDAFEARPRGSGIVRAKRSVEASSMQGRSDMKAWRIFQAVGALALTVGILLRVGDLSYGIVVAIIGAVVLALGWLGAWLRRE
jgi:hypothetical protein